MKPCTSSANFARCASGKAFRALRTESMKYCSPTGKLSDSALKKAVRKASPPFQRALDRRVQVDQQAAYGQIGHQGQGGSAQQGQWQCSGVAWAARRDNCTSPPVQRHAAGLVVRVVQCQRAQVAA